MNRLSKLSMLVALGLCSSQLMAVDLGQIQVKSALGQPLVAEIPVQSATPAELQQLSAQLASNEDFTRAGIMGGRTAIPLHFAVTTVGGRHVIRITSTTPVDDPFLDLLVEVHGATGKSVREFTILLDPPGTPASPAAPAVAAPAPTAPAPRTAAPSHATAASTPAPAAAPTPAPASAKPAATAGSQYGPVTRGQTLSSIARQAAPAEVDVHQMLLAIKQANPDAFYRDNINALKTGAVLRIPTASQAQAMTVAAAVAEVRRQNSDWRAGPAAAPTTVADMATRADASSAPTPTADNAGDRLALVPAKGEGSDTAKTAGNSTAVGKGEDAAALRQNLLRAQESLASAQQQSTDLKAQLKELADVNDKNTRLLSLKDSQIAELQDKLAAAARKGEPAPAVSTAAAAGSTVAGAASAAVPAGAGSAAPLAAAGSAAAAPEAAASVAAASSAAVAPGVVAASTAAAPPVAAPVDDAAAKPESPAAAPQPDASLMPWYMQPWAWAAGAGAIVLLLLLALLGRRRKTPLMAAGAASSLADRFSTSPSTDAPTDDVPVTEATDALSATDTDQDELLDQLAERPDDLGLNLELVTLYYSRRDVEHFEAAAEAMYAHITDPAQADWQEVVRMGEDLAPTHPLFEQQPPPATSAADDGTLAGFDIDAGVDAEADPSAPASSLPPPLSTAPKPVGGYAFDFNLTPAAAPVAGVPAEAGDEASTADEAAGEALAQDDPGTWKFAADETVSADPPAALGEFNDDPVDTKLDLARAYLDMGDAEGARAMLDEVVQEGSQMQRDVARELLAGLDH